MTVLRKLTQSLILASVAVAPAAMAKVSSAEADKLGKSLTVMGAETAGNAAGTIPAYTGGLTQAPAGYGGAGKHHVDPFPGDKPLFTITAQNMDKYADQLTDGQKALFKAYPDTFKMPIYQTRRTHAVPQRVADATKKNATTAELAEGGNGISGAYGGIPFPVPQSALEVYWNHITRYRGEYIIRRANDINVQPDGSWQPVKIHQEVKFKFYDPKGSEETLDNVVFFYKSKTLSPSTLAGGALLVHETLDQVKEPRRAWSYSAGQRRVRKAPTVSFDTPAENSDGLRTADDTDMINGAPVRFDWKLVGKKEVYIPYNNYRIQAEGVKYDDLIMPGHVNPDLTRYELHRVWVLEGTVKPDTSHIYAKRVLYIDEDSWSAAEVDQFDDRGQLWRVSMAYLKNYYELPTTWTALDVFHDLQSRRYQINSATSEESGGVQTGKKVPSDSQYKPTALRRFGK